MTSSDREEISRIQLQFNEYMKNIEQQKEQMQNFFRQKEEELEKKTQTQSKNILQDYQTKYSLDQSARELFEQKLLERFDFIIKDMIYDYLDNDEYLTKRKVFIQQQIQKASELEKVLDTIKEEDIYEASQGENNKEKLKEEIQGLKLLRQRINKKVRLVEGENEHEYVTQVQQYVKDKFAKYSRRFLQEYRTRKTLQQLSEQRIEQLKKEINSIEQIEVTIDPSQLDDEVQISKQRIEQQVKDYLDYDERRDDEEKVSMEDLDNEMDIAVPENDEELLQEEINKTYFYKIQNFPTATPKYVIYAHLSDPYDYTFAGFVYFFDVSNSQRENDRKMKFYSQFFPEYIRVTSAKFSIDPYNVKTQLSSLSVQAELDIKKKQLGNGFKDSMNNQQVIDQLVQRHYSDERESQKRLQQCIKNNQLQLEQQKKEEQRKLDQMIGGIGQKDKNSKSMGTLYEGFM